jgi:histidinol phosphatase-like PHP family hydrolase
MKMSPRSIKKPGLIFQANELDLTNLPRIDSHLHTSWTDGEATVEAVHRAAIERGLAAILYSEHSRKTSTDWFSSFAAEVRALPSSPCKAYVGTEVKVESREGEIDTVPAIGDLCDFVMASVHRFIDANGRTLQFFETDPNEAVDLEFELTWAALENPQVDILGHMFGMSYRRFNVIPPDNKICALISRAAEFGVAVEINSHYHPEPRKMIQWCRDYNALITFGSNAHTLENVGAIMRLLDQEAGNV